MIALSIKQPYAERIARGEKTEEFRTWMTKHRGPMLVVSSRATDAPGSGNEARGVAVCVVDITGIRDMGGRFAWQLANPRRVQNVALRGSASFFHVNDESIVYVKGDPLERAPQRAKRSTSTTKRARKAAPVDVDDDGEDFGIDSKEAAAREAAEGASLAAFPRGAKYVVIVDANKSIATPCRTFAEASKIAVKLATQHKCYARAFKRSPFGGTCEAFALPPGL